MQRLQLHILWANRMKTFARHLPEAYFKGNQHTMKINTIKNFNNSNDWMNIKQ